MLSFFSPQKAGKHCFFIIAPFPGKPILAPRSALHSKQQPLVLRGPQCHLLLMCSTGAVGWSAPVCGSAPGWVWSAP